MKATTGRTGKNTNLYLDDATKARAKLIGEGSISEGIKKAIAGYVRESHITDGWNTRKCYDRIDVALKEYIYHRAQMHEPTLDEDDLVGLMSGVDEEGTRWYSVGAHGAAGTNVELRHVLDFDDWWDKAWDNKVTV